ncbi:MAG: hypothetical protein U0271_34035 [Polyangiaceae bacterium]
MLGRRDEEFPLEAVRDLLGVVRSMYAAAKQRRASRAELSRIAAVGRELSDAIDLAVTTRPGTVGHRAAWERAEHATRAVGDLVDALTPAEPLVVAARGRVTGARVALKRPREER